MLRNYLRIAFRHLWRHRTFSLLNIVGLTIGMSACFLVFLYVRFELSYDAFHSKADRIYQIGSTIKTPTDNFYVNVTAPATAPALKDAFPEIGTAVRFWRQSILF